MTAKTIVVVGAGPGLGLSIAKRFGKEGFQVALIARHQEKLDGLVAELEQDGITAASFVGDVTDDRSVKSAFEGVKQRFGHVDVLEYSPITIPATPAEYAPLEVTALTPEVAQRSYSVMALGAVSSVQQVLPEMLARGQGTIIITAGISSRGFMPMIGAWGMAGSAVRNYARTLHLALKDKSIFVGYVCLGVQIRKGDAVGDPDLLAQQYYAMYLDRGRPEIVINRVPEGMITWDTGEGVSVY